MALSEEVKKRLKEYQFSRACSLAAREIHEFKPTGEEESLVNALAAIFSDCGKFTGDMHVVIDLALENIGIEKDWE